MSATDPHTPSLDSEHYYHRSQRPLQALMFLLPLIVLYEVGAILYASNPHTGQTQDILARALLSRALDMFGAVGGYLPGLLVIVVLLGWHIAKRDPWRFEWRLYLAMWAESLALAIPVLMFALIIGRHSIASMQMLTPTLALAEAHSWQAQLVFAIGAGIYEELVFRLMAITLLHLLLADLLKLKAFESAAISIVGAAVLFAAYHFNANNPFQWDKFLFYTVSGAYLGVLFVFRGFGIVAGAHAIYDILFVAIEQGVLPTGDQ